jgi:hypothetical protein
MNLKLEMLSLLIKPKVSLMETKENMEKPKVPTLMLVNLS